MSDLTPLVAGNRLTNLVARFPRCGIWTVDADLHEEVDLSGKVDVTLGGLTLTGTAHPDFTGKFAGKGVVRVVAGANGWSRSIKRKDYSDDLGVKRQVLVIDAAREAGETLGTLPSLGRLDGVKYTRQLGPASRTLELVLGRGWDWWLDWTGTTQIGTRALVEVTAAYDLLEYDPRARIAKVACDDPTVIQVGSVLRNDRLPRPFEVREVELVIEGGAVRFSLWGREVTS